MPDPKHELALIKSPAEKLYVRLIELFEMPNFLNKSSAEFRADQEKLLEQILKQKPDLSYHPDPARPGILERAVMLNWPVGVKMLGDHLSYDPTIQWQTKRKLIDLAVNRISDRTDKAVVETINYMDENLMPRQKKLLERSGPFSTQTYSPNDNALREIVNILHREKPGTNAMRKKILQALQSKPDISGKSALKDKDGICVIKAETRSALDWAISLEADQDVIDILSDYIFKDVRVPESRKQEIARKAPGLFTALPRNTAQLDAILLKRKPIDFKLSIGEDLREAALLQEKFLSKIFKSSGRDQSRADEPDAATNKPATITPGKLLPYLDCPLPQLDNANFY